MNNIEKDIRSARAFFILAFLIPFITYIWWIYFYFKYFLIGIFIMILINLVLLPIGKYFSLHIAKWHNSIDPQNTNKQELEQLYYKINKTGVLIAFFLFISTISILHVIGVKVG